MSGRKKIIKTKQQSEAHSLKECSSYLQIEALRAGFTYPAALLRLAVEAFKDISEPPPKKTKVRSNSRKKATVNS